MAQGSQECRRLPATVWDFGREPIAARRPPSQWRHIGLAGSLHDLCRTAPSGGQKHNLGPPYVLLRAIAVGDHSLKLAAVGSAQSDIGSFVHPTDLRISVMVSGDFTRW
jgi:hypothetical protein